MDHPKKILILYASAGHGHEKAAKAIDEACRESPAANIQILDTLALNLVGYLYRQTYLVQIKYTPWLWGMFYNSLNLKWIYNVARILRRFFNAMTARDLESLLLKEKPDVIIATHFLAVEVASHLRTKGKISSKIITVITDYLPHRIWTASAVDFYAVALAETKKQLVQWGVSSDKVFVTGIPVEKKFLESLSTEEARSRLGLNPTDITVLITSGGGGIGSTKNIVEGLLALKKSVQILAVCGTNQTLFQTLNLRAGQEPALKVFGLVKNMQELMAASDLVIGKGGGLTITESFSKSKPVILFESIPGQEAGNAACVTKYKAGFVAESQNDVIQKIFELYGSPGELESMKKGVHAMFKPDAAKEIAALSLKVV